ncbi:MAG TPA: hypothetical protein P5091_01865 [Acholeplasmataceae bacterium]|nr:hypothetical protein [Acholeplasmataceae bacterium]
MEKTVDKKISKSQQNQDLEALIEDVSVQDTPKPKKTKGPKTIIKEELVTMQGDPLGLHVPLDDEPQEAIDLKSRVKQRMISSLNVTILKLKKDYQQKRLNSAKWQVLLILVIQDQPNRYPISLEPIFLHSLTF